MKIRKKVREAAVLPLLCSRYEAARMLAISVPLLDRLTAEEKIRSIKIGDRRMFSIKELGRFIEERLS